MDNNFQLNSAPISTSKVNACNNSNSSGERSGGGCVEETSESEDEDSSSSSSLSNDGSSGPPSLFDSDGEDCGTSSASRHTISNDLAQFYAEWRSELRNAEGNKKSSTSSEPMARRLFRLGMRQEAAGDSMAAVMFYRQAVNLVPDIEFRITTSNVSHKPRRSNRRSCSTSSGELMVSAHQQEQEQRSSSPISSLTSLLERFSLNCGGRAFIQPADVSRSCPMATLPPEICLYLLCWLVGTELDLRSLDNIALVCQGWYLLARDSELWRAICVRLWSTVGADNNIWLEACGFLNWRDMAINRPHLHFNGCYLSKASYVRPGEPAIDAWYPAFQQVIYYRACRFHSDGRCYFLTSSDQPASLVKVLASAWPASRRIAGLLEGHYQLQDSHLTAVLHRATSPSTLFYVQLKIEQRGRSGLIFGALRWTHYEYRNMSESTATPLLLEAHQYPLMQFSRVRSYLRTSRAPLRFSRNAGVLATAAPVDGLQTLDETK